MKIVSLDVHSEASQLVAMSEEGEIILEMKVATDMALLRRVIPLGVLFRSFEFGTLNLFGIWDFGFV